MRQARTLRAAGRAFQRPPANRGTEPVNLPVLADALRITLSAAITTEGMWIVTPDMRRMTADARTTIGGARTTNGDMRTTTGGANTTTGGSLRVRVLHQGDVAVARP
jgi:hypothetical protein